MGYIVLTVTSAGIDAEALNKIASLFAVAIYAVVDGALITLLPYLKVDDVLAHINLVGNFDCLISAVAIEDDNVVDIRTVAHEFSLLETSTNEALLTVDIEFLVSLYHLGSLDGVEVAYLGKTGMLGTVFVLQMLIPFAGNINDTIEFALYLGYLAFYLGYQFVSLVFGEFQYALHLYLHEAQDIVFGHLPHKLRIERCEAFVDMLTCSIHGSRILVFLVLIYAFLYKYLLKRTEEELLKEFLATNLQFALEQGHSLVGAALEHITNGEELRFLVFDDAAVRRNAYLTIGEGIEGIEGLVGRDTRSEVNEYLDISRREVFHLAHLYLTFLYRLSDRLDECFGSFRERYVADYQRFLVKFLNLCSNLNRATSLSVVILAHINRTTCREVGVEMEFLTTKIGYGSITYLTEIVRHDFGVQSYGNAFYTLSQKEREFYRQGDRFLVTSVIGHLPLGGLRIEDRLKGKLAQSCLDITWCCS